MKKICFILLLSLVGIAARAEYVTLSLPLTSVTPDAKRIKEAALKSTGTIYHPDKGGPVDAYEFTVDADFLIKVAASAGQELDLIVLETPYVIPANWHYETKKLIQPIDRKLRPLKEKCYELTEAGKYLGKAIPTPQMKEYIGETIANMPEGKDKQDAQKEFAKGKLHKKMLPYLQAEFNPCYQTWLDLRLEKAMLEADLFRMAAAPDINKPGVMTPKIEKNAKMYMQQFIDECQAEDPNLYYNVNLRLNGLALDRPFIAETQPGAVGEVRGTYYDTIPNPFNLQMLRKFSNNLPAYENAISKGRIAQWEWAVNVDRLSYNVQNYPKYIRYYTHPDHPEYRVIYTDIENDVYVYDDGYLREGSHENVTRVFDTNGKLVAVPAAYEDHGTISWYDKKNNFHVLLLRKRYQENAYGIQKASAATQKYIKERLGILPMPKTLKGLTFDTDGMNWIKQIESDLGNMRMWFTKEMVTPTTWVFHAYDKNNRHLFDATRTYKNEDNLPFYSTYTSKVTFFDWY